MTEQPARPQMGEPGPVLASDAHPARGWSQCCLCGEDIAPGQRIAIPAGRQQYAHCSCIAAEAAVRENHNNEPRRDK
jgi:hypothetical protein